MSLYMTLDKSSPVIPSFRGDPRRPKANTTLEADAGPEDVSTEKFPVSPEMPVSL